MLASGALAFVLGLCAVDSVSSWAGPAKSRDGLVLPTGYERFLGDGSISNAARTRLPDGRYAPDSFGWSGGTGRLGDITCSLVFVRDGHSYATIVLESPSYSKIRVNGVEFDNATPGTQVSTFTIPVTLGRNMAISGLTTAMSEPHWIEYTIFCYVIDDSAVSNPGFKTNQGSAAADGTSLDAAAPNIPGFGFVSAEDVTYARYFKIFTYEQGVSLIEIDVTADTERDPRRGGVPAADAGSDSGVGSATDSGDATGDMDISTNTVDSGDADTGETQNTATSQLYSLDVLKYLVVPEGVEVPAGLDKEYIVVRQPADTTLVASNDALGFLDQLQLVDEIEGIAMSWSALSVESVAEMVESGSIRVSGSYDEPDFRGMIAAGDNLFIQDGTVLPHDCRGGIIADADTSDGIVPDTDDTTKDLDMQVQGLSDLGSRFSTLGIPMLVDRSMDERSDLARAEWVKVYGAIYGCTEKATSAFDEVLEDAGGEPTGIVVE